MPVNTTPIISSAASAGEPAGSQPYFEINSPSSLIQTYPNAVGILYLGTMLTSYGPITLNGSAEEVLDTDSSGTAVDSNGNGRDDIATQMTQFNLSGTSTLGSVHVSLRPNVLSPYQDSIGTMEEQVNNTPGTLDLPPFISSGQVDSFFDIYLRVEFGGQVYHNESALTINGTFQMTPHQPRDRYTSLTTPQLFDSSNNPTIFLIESFVYFPIATARVFPRAMGILILDTPTGATESITLHGVAADRLDIYANGAAVDNTGNGLDDIYTIFIQLDLKGTSGLGQIHLLLRSFSKSPYQPCAGKMEELANNSAGILDTPPFAVTGLVESFFDVYLEIQIGGLPVHNESPLSIQGVFGSAFPFPGNTYIAANNPSLYDDNNQPTGLSIAEFIYYPIPYPNMLPLIMKN
jgi:hypothetical protein